MSQTGSTLTSSDGITFTLNVPTNSSTNTAIGTVTTASTTGSVYTSVSNNSPSIGPCMHGIYGQCSACYSSAGQSIGQYCTCSTFGSVCPIHSLQNTPNPPNYCTCGQYNSIGCPVHLTGTGTISVTPSWVAWPPAPPSVDLHAKEGHRVSHEMVTDEKGLKIVFKCSFCNDIIYKKYLIRIPRKVREQKCLVRVLNHR
jgi:hypothetical protein